MATAEKKKRTKSDKSVGRPLKFESPGELQVKIEEYFNSCFEEMWNRNISQDGDVTWTPITDREGIVMRQQVRPFTISGLAVHLGTTRETLLDYEERDEYSDTIKRAKAIIENYTEEQLFDKSAKNMTGIIFNLKNNYSRWVDKQEVDSNIGNKDGKPFETKDAVAKLTVEELRKLAQTKPSAD